MSYNDLQRSPEKYILYAGEVILKSRGFHDNSVCFHLDIDVPYPFGGKKAGPVEYGDRFYAVIYQIDEEGLPINQNMAKEMSTLHIDPARIITSSIMMCKDTRFHDFIQITAKGHLASLILKMKRRQDKIGLEQLARDYITAICGINSRAELKSDNDARKKFIRLRRDFNSYIYDLEAVHGEYFQGR